MDIRFTPVAIADVREIKEHIAEDNPAAAEWVAVSFTAKIENLAIFPLMGPSLSIKVGIPTEYRYLVCESYLIIYKPEAEYISVYRILNAARDYLSLLFPYDTSD